MITRKKKNKNGTIIIIIDIHWHSVRNRRVKIYVFDATKNVNIRTVLQGLGAIAVYCLLFNNYLFFLFLHTGRI